MTYTFVSLHTVSALLCDLLLQTDRSCCHRFARQSASCGLSCNNRGPVALCTLGMGLLNPPSSQGR